MFGQECWYFLKSFHKCTLFYKKKLPIVHNKKP